MSESWSQQSALVLHAGGGGGDGGLPQSVATCSDDAKGSVVPSQFDEQGEGEKEEEERICGKKEEVREEKCPAISPRSPIVRKVIEGRANGRVMDS